MKKTRWFLFLILSFCSHSTPKVDKIYYFSKENHSLSQEIHTLSSAENILNILKLSKNYRYLLQLDNAEKILKKIDPKELPRDFLVDFELETLSVFLEKNGAEKTRPRYKLLKRNPIFTSNIKYELYYFYINTTPSQDSLLKIITLEKKFSEKVGLNSSYMYWPLLTKSKILRRMHLYSEAKATLNRAYEFASLEKPSIEFEIIKYYYEGMILSILLKSNTDFEIYRHGFYKIIYNSDLPTGYQMLYDTVVHFHSTLNFSYLQKNLHFLESQFGPGHYALEGLHYLLKNKT